MDPVSVQAATAVSQIASKVREDVALLHVVLCCVHDAAFSSPRFLQCTVMTYVY